MIRKNKQFHDGELYTLLANNAGKFYLNGSEIYLQFFSKVSVTKITFTLFTKKRKFDTFSFPDCFPWRFTDFSPGPNILVIQSLKRAEETEIFFCNFLKTEDKIGKKLIATENHFTFLFVIQISKMKIHNENAFCLLNNSGEIKMCS